MKLATSLRWILLLCEMALLSLLERRKNYPAPHEKMAFHQEGSCYSIPLFIDLFNIYPNIELIESLLHFQRKSSPGANPEHRYKS